MPRFKLTTGADKKEAMNAYAHQMASLETQAQYTRDFLASPELNTPALAERSYTLMARRQAYDNQMNGEGTNKFTVSNSVIADMMTRNPFLKDEDFNAIRQHNQMPRSTVIEGSPDVLKQDNPTKLLILNRLLLR